MSRIDEALKRAAGVYPGRTAGRAAESTLKLADEVPLDQYLAEAPAPESVKARPTTIDEPAIARPRVSAFAERPLVKVTIPPDAKLVIGPEVDAASVEQYRRLAAMLHEAQVEKGLKTVMVTSAGPGDGNIWFTDFDNSRIGRTNASGGAITLPIDLAPGKPNDMVAGTNAWVVDTDQDLHCITPAGDVTTRFSGLADPDMITRSPGGAIWYGDGPQLSWFTEPANCTTAPSFQGGTFGFGGACPPAGDEPHRYVFTVYALGTETLEVPGDATAALIASMLDAHAIARAEFTATYGRE